VARGDRHHTDRAGAQIMTTTSTMILPPTLHAPSIARRHLRLIAARLPPGHLDPAVLVTSELVTNAVIHGQPDIALDIRLEPTALRVAVTDANPQLPPATIRPPRPESRGGRGLLIVEALATRWGITPLEQPGKSVWFLLNYT
jgi:anti-sigma regulatory factor (Ser/Thr protein kinase)